MGYFDLVPLKIIACGVYALTVNRYINFNEDDLNRMSVAFNELVPLRPAPVKRPVRPQSAVAVAPGDRSLREKGCRPSTCVMPNGMRPA